MDAAADDRLRSIVLFGAVLAVLAVGGWWWQAAAPASTAGTAGAATPTPTVQHTVSTRWTVSWRRGSQCSGDDTGGSGEW
ncbi:hypothetical protein NKG94_38445 [Micromonospora sp. M12]